VWGGGCGGWRMMELAELLHAAVSGLGQDCGA